MVGVDLGGHSARTSKSGKNLSTEELLQCTAWRSVVCCAADVHTSKQGIDNDDDTMLRHSPNWPYYKVKSIHPSVSHGGQDQTVTIQWTSTYKVARQIAAYHVGTCLRLKCSHQSLKSMLLDI